MGMQVSALGNRFKLRRDRVGWHDSLRDEIGVLTEETRGACSSGDALEASGAVGQFGRFEFSFRYKVCWPLVLKAVDSVVHMGDRIGILGLSGRGKTTLIKLLTDPGKTPSTEAGLLLPERAGKVCKHPPRLNLGCLIPDEARSGNRLVQSRDPRPAAKSSRGLPRRTASGGPISSPSYPGTPACQDATRQNHMELPELARAG